MTEDPPDSEAASAWIRRDVLALFGLAFAAALGWLMLPGCGFGLFVLIAPVYLTVQRKTLLRGRPESGRPLPFMPSGVATVGTLGVGLASLMGGAVVDQLMDAGSTPWVHELSLGGGALLGAAVFGATTAPLLTLPVAWIDPERPRNLRRALLASSHLVATHPLRMVGMAALHAVLLVTPVLAAIGLRNYFALALGGLLTPALAYGSARLYRVHVAAPDPLADGVAMAPRLRVMLALAAVACAVALAGVAGMAWSPAPARMISLPGAQPDGGYRLSDRPGWLKPLPARLPGTAVVLRSHAGGVLVAMDDGGGAGVVSVPHDFSARAAGVTPEGAADLLAGRPSRVYLEAGEAHYVICLDAHGVRCDDSTAERIVARIPWTGWAPLLLALLLFVRFLWRNVPDLLAHSKLGELRERGEAKGVRGLSGTLRWGETGSVVPSAGWGHRASSVAVAGDVSLDAGDFVVPLPGGAIRAIADRNRSEEFRDGAKLTLVGEFQQVVPGGFRQATIDFPASPWLVPGDLHRAEEHLAAKTSREVVVSLALATCSLLFTILLVGVSLLDLVP